MCVVLRSEGHYICLGNVEFVKSDPKWVVYNDLPWSSKTSSKINGGLFSVFNSFDAAIRHVPVEYKIRTLRYALKRDNSSGTVSFLHSL